MRHFIVSLHLWAIVVTSTAVHPGCPSTGQSGDASLDGDTDGPVCSEASGCDDGRFCNGAELCAPEAAGADSRGCIAGAPPSCLDGQVCSTEENRCITDCDVTRDADGDGVDALECGGDDCDDTDRRRYYGNVEVCDSEGLDEDCIQSTLGHDMDGDGVESDECCNYQLDGTLLCGEDCNDDYAGVSPRLEEEDCDHYGDNNCDGVNEHDGDGDGFDDVDCGGNDCDDSNPELNPGRADVCGNDIDENCDGFANDMDCDGHDDVAHTTVGCENCDDCDDSDPEIYPGAPERCNALDDDCNGEVPDHEDRDEDGAHACEDGPAATRDCDDDDPSRFPGNPELCGDGIDQDCDEVVDGQPCWVIVQAGTFDMGSPTDERGRDEVDDEDLHEVTLTRGFFILSTEVTQQHFEELMGYNNSHFVDCPSCPVERETWHEAEAFCNALSDQAGLDRCYGCRESDETVTCWSRHESPHSCPGYRLPTEAEWEYAARAETTRATYAGNLEAEACSSTPLDAIAWYSCNSEGRTHEVGGLGPNAWGLYDMLGNVGEWLYEYYGAYPTGPVTDPFGPVESPHRMARGGSYIAIARLLRAADRTSYNCESSPPFGNATGFRPIRTIP